MFEPFPNLPYDLRFTIWELAFSEPTIIYFWRSRKRSNKLFEISQACKEARNIYEKMLRPVLLPHSTSDQGSVPTIPIWLSFPTTTFCLGGQLATADKAMRALEAYKDLVQHVALKSFRPRTMTTLRHSLHTIEQLKTITVLVGPNYGNLLANEETEDDSDGIVLSFLKQTLGITSQSPPSENFKLEDRETMMYKFMESEKSPDVKMPVRVLGEEGQACLRVSYFDIRYIGELDEGVFLFMR